MTAAKRWVPLLCAFTGARVAEITQLRKADFRKEGDVHVGRITPDAGSTKTGQWRDVPLHRQIIALGFLDYLECSPDGPIFHNATDPPNLVTTPRRWRAGLATGCKKTSLSLRASSRHTDGGTGSRPLDGRQEYKIESWMLFRATRLGLPVTITAILLPIPRPTRLNDCRTTI